MLLWLFDPSVRQKYESNILNIFRRLIKSYGMVLTIACLLVAFAEMTLTDFQSGDIFVAQVRSSLLLLHRSLLLQI